MNVVVRMLGSVMIVTVAGLLLVVGGPAAPAAAHASLAGSNPPSGAILPDPPQQVVLTFSESVRLASSRIVVLGPEGKPVDIGEPTTDDTDVIIPLGGVSDTGTYLVSYWVVSQDGHPVSGGLTYSVGTPSQVPKLSADLELGDATVSGLVGINKYLGYLGVALLIGPGLMLALFWPRRLSRRGAARLLYAGLGLVAVSTLAGLWLQAPYMAGAALFGATADDVREVLVSPFGAAYLVRLGVLVAVALLVRPLLTAGAGRWRRSADRWRLLLLGGLALAGLGTWPMAGHAFASPQPALSIIADTVHIGAAGLWIGGLVVLIGFLLRRADQRELRVILPAWSRWAQLAVAALLLAGVVQALIEIGPLGALVTTVYGRLLLVKVGLAATVIAVARYSRRLVRAGVAANRPLPLRRAVAVEVTVLVGVLAMSSVLVQTTPGRSAAQAIEPVSATQAAGFKTTLHTKLYSLDVTVAPTAVGSCVIRLAASAPQGGPQLVEEWQATAALPAAGIEPIDISILGLADGNAVGQARLPVPGQWKFKFTLRTSEIDQASVEVTVPIS